MTTDLVTIRELAQEYEPLEDGLIWPVPAAEANSVSLEPRDGDLVSTVACQSITVRRSGEKRADLSVSEISATLFITDARVAIACSKFDKGGGWVGTPGLMIAANLGSKMLAARRRRGKVLVGQVRYPWLRSVYSRNKDGRKSSELLRLVTRHNGESVYLELTLPKDVSATDVATEVIKRAATFRLAHDPEPGEDAIARLRELQVIEPLTWTGGDLAGHSFGSAWPIGQRSAKFGAVPGERA